MAIMVLASEKSKENCAPQFCLQLQGFRCSNGDTSSRNRCPAKYGNIVVNSPHSLGIQCTSTQLWVLLSLNFNTVHLQHQQTLCKTNTGWTSASNCQPRHRVLNTQSTRVYHFPRPLVNYIRSGRLISHHDRHTKLGATQSPRPNPGHLEPRQVWQLRALARLPSCGRFLRPNR